MLFVTNSILEKEKKRNVIMASLHLMSKVKCHNVGDVRVPILVCELGKFLPEGRSLIQK